MNIWIDCHAEGRGVVGREEWIIVSGGFMPEMYGRFRYAFTGEGWEKLWADRRGPG